MSGRFSPDPLDSPPPGDHSPGHIIGWDDSQHEDNTQHNSTLDDNDLPEVEVDELHNHEERNHRHNIIRDASRTNSPQSVNNENYNTTDNDLPIVDFSRRLFEAIIPDPYGEASVVNGDSDDSVATVDYNVDNSLEVISNTSHGRSNRTSTVTSLDQADDTRNAFSLDYAMPSPIYQLVSDAEFSENVNQSEEESNSNSNFRAASPINQPPSVQSISENSNDNVSAGNNDHNSNNSAAQFRNISTTELATRKGEPLSEEPPAKLRKISSPKSPGSDAEGDSCPICLEPWGNSGDHRLVSLKCGHLFGYKCVERWFRAQKSKRSCPTCKSKSNLRDIRFIFARKLIAADLTEITTLQKEVERLKTEKNRVELELQRTNIAHRSTVNQLEALRNSIASRAPERNVRKGWRFALEKNLEICKDGGCRVMTYNCRTYELYVSQKSTNNLFPGYGVRRVSCVDYKLNQFIHLHPKHIRDVSYSQPKDLLLSVSLDATARIVERGIPSVCVQTRSPLWSCAWDVLNENHLFAGGVGGTISEYDIRYPASPLNTFTSPSDLSPIISLCSTEFGLLSCSLNSSHLWVPSTTNWVPKFLPIEGPYMSMAYDMDSHRALVSCRPNNIEKSRLVVCKLRSELGETTCNVEQVITGSARSTLMSRATYVKVPGASWLAAHSESESSLYLHGIDGSRTMSLPASEPALDVCSVNLNGDTLLTALSESRLRIYKAVPTNL